MSTPLWNDGVMQRKQFVVEFEFDGRTRWIGEDDHIKKCLGILLESLARIQTDGTLPRISVLSIDCSPINSGELICGQLK